MEYRPQYTNVVPDFDETFSTNRGLNLKRFGKKNFFKTLLFSQKYTQNAFD